jgi:DNA-directed RNA polymerase specialized sigma54-like protein
MQVTPDVFVRKVRAAMRRIDQATLPRLLVNRRYYQELKSGPQDKGVAGVAQRMPGQAPTGWSKRSTSAPATIV